MMAFLVSIGLMFGVIAGIAIGCWLARDAIGHAIMRGLNW